MMKSFLALMIFLTLSPSVRAVGPDDQYITIYNLIQQGDVLLERGEPEPALEKYTEAQSQLKAFQTNNPEWYTKVVKYRLNYLAAKIAQLSSSTASPVPPPSVKPATTANTEPSHIPAIPPPVRGNTPSTPPAPAGTKDAALTAAEAQINALQDQIRNVEADRSSLEAKLKEALAAQPATADPRELARAQEQIKALQKQNELLNTSLAQAKTSAAQANPAAIEESRKALEEANRKVAQMTAANATLSMEKQALEARFKTLSASPDSALAALRDENQILKKQLASVKSNEAVAPQGGDFSQKLQEAQSQLAVLQSEQLMWRLEKTALENQLKNRPPAPALVLNARPTTALPSTEMSTERIRELEAERDELKKSLATATKLVSGGRKSKEMAAHMIEMTQEMATLRARIDVLEAHSIPYTAEELSLLSKPDGTALVAEAVHHSARANTSRELSPKLAVLWSEAKQYWVAHDLEKAEAKYLEMIKLDSKNSTLLTDLACIETDRGHTADAEQNLKAALLISPDDDYSLSILGVLKLREEKFDESLEAFSRAAQANPQNAKIQNYIGIALSEKGVRGPAEAAFRKAIQIDPGYGDAHANLAFVYLTQKPPLVELARWHYKKALDAGHVRDLSMEKLLDQTKPTATR